MLQLAGFCQPEDWLRKADSLRDIDPAKSSELVNLILSGDSSQMKDITWARALQLNGLVKMYDYQFEESSSYFHRAYRILVPYEGSDQYQKELGKLFMDIGRNYVWQSKFDTALSVLLKANMIFENGEFEKEQAESLNSLAIVYIRYSRDPDKALETFLKSLDISIGQQDTASMARIMQNVGQIYNMIGVNDSALYYLRLSNTLVEKLQDFRSLAIGSNIIAAVFYDIGSLDSSELYFRKAINLDQANQDSIGLIHDYNQLATTLFALNKLEEAIYYGQLAFDNTKDIFIKAESAQTLSEIMEKRNNYRSALKYFQEYKYYSDSARNADQQETIAELQTQYETAEKEKTIQKAQDEIQRQRITQQYLSIIVAIVLIASVTVVIIQRQKSQLKNKALSGEITDLRMEIKTLIGKYEGEINLEYETLNENLVNPLSEREFDIFKHIYTQKSNQEIADELFVSINTVKTHLKNIYGKLGVTNRKEALEVILKDA